VVTTNPHLPLLQGSGWSAAETEYRQPDGSTVWQVEANRDEHRVLVWGRTRGDAWRAAHRMFRRIEQSRS
jgi:hypothetical protein